MSADVIRMTKFAEMQQSTGSTQGVRPASSRQLTPIRLLLASGCPKIRRNWRESLASLHPEIIEAGCMTDAIAALSSFRLDLVLVDLQFDNVGAIEFCRTLKHSSATRYLPVFVIASKEDPDSEVSALEAEADGFFVSPLQPRIFQARVQATVRHKALFDSLNDSESVLFSLAQSMEDRDPGLGRHCERLALMASSIGLALNLPASDIVALQRAGYLHDIGKVAVPDHILFKAGSLTPEEWDIMKAHPERGERICSAMRSLQSTLPIIRHHHERWDGGGYPDKLKGEQIPLLARILQLADIYDALTTARPYKRAFTPEEAIAVIREEAARGWRDPQLVEQFSELLPVFRTNVSGLDLSQFSLHSLAHSVATLANQPVPSSSDIER
jgi:putative two-component system response regulator